MGTHAVLQDLLDYEGGHSLGELTAHLHGPQAQRYDLGGQQKVDDLCVVNLRQSPNISASLFMGYCLPAC